MKRCTKCGEEKPLDAFYLDGGKPRGNCKECHKAFQRQRRQENPDEVSAVRRARYARKKDVILAQQKAHRDTNKARINAERRAKRAADPEKHRRVQREWWAKNADRIAEERRKWWAENKERVNAAARARRRQNPEKARQYEREYRAANREHVNAMGRAYYAKNPEKWEAARRAREARKANVEWQPYTRREIYDRDGGRCRLCGEELPLAPGAFQLDHIVPISLGGPDIPANLQLTCPPCNRAKWAKLEGQIYLPV